MSNSRRTYIIPSLDKLTDRLDLTQPIDEQVEEQVRRTLERLNCPIKFRAVKRECKPPHISIQIVSHGTEINGN